jgi:type I restriction enzyme M protein
MRKELYAKLDEKDAAYRWQDFALKQVYGIEINSQLARVSMMNMIIHEDGHTNIENADALDNPDNWKRQKIREYFSKKFTLLLTNPPFGASVKEREKPYLASYELGGKLKRRNRQNTEILFIERCLDFLKPGGRMGIVLPDGILTNSSLQYVRDFVNGKTQILGVVSLPQTAFKRPASKGSGDSGSGVKASLLFLRKKKDDENLPKDYPIFMAIAEHIGYDSTGRPDKDEFPDILNAWQEFRKKSRINFFVKAPLCFTIGRGEIKERFDPYYNSPKFRKIIKTSRNIDLVEFRDLIDLITKGETPLWRGDSYVPKGIPFLKVQNISEEGIKGEISFISNEVHQRMKRSQLKGGELLYSMAGTIGIATILPEDFGIANINQAIAKVILKKEVNKKYLKFILNSNFCKTQAQMFLTTAAQPNINFEQIKSIKIPLPPREIQDKIASLMDEAYKAKRGKESEAEKLLISIETCILETLSIRILEKEEKRPKFFDVRADVMKGGRLDPFHYLPKFMLQEKALSACKYPLKTIGEILSGPIVNGLDARKFVEAGTKYLRVGNIKPDEINETDIKFVNIPIENIKKDIKLEPGDVLLTRKGTFGVSAVVRGTTDYIISSEIMRLRLKKEVNPFCFSIINNTSVIQEQYKQKAVGAIMGSLSQEVLKTVKVPIPSGPIQDKIVKEFHEKRKKAKKLREEAKELLEKAKREVEDFIEKN